MLFFSIGICLNILKLILTVLMIQESNRQIQVKDKALQKLLDIDVSIMFCIIELFSFLIITPYLHHMEMLASFS